MQIVTFFVNFQKHCYVLAFFVGYLLRASFFQDHFQLQAPPLLQSFSPSIGYPMDRRYFNQEATSAIFSKNFLTNFFFGLLLAFLDAYQLEGQFFGSLKFRKIFYKTLFFENRIVQSSGTSKKGTSVTRSPVITKTGWLKCQWCGCESAAGRFPTPRVPRANMGDLYHIDADGLQVYLRCES